MSITMHTSYTISIKLTIICFRIKSVNIRFTFHNIFREVLNVIKIY